MVALCLVVCSSIWRPPVADSDLSLQDSPVCRGGLDGDSIEPRKLLSPIESFSLWAVVHSENLLLVVMGLGDNTIGNARRKDVVCVSGSGKVYL